MAQALDLPTEDASPVQDNAIEIEGMRKAYGRTVAVRNLSLHVPQGSVYGFVGPNGAGKTTTIRTLATLQRADAGAIRVAGIDIRTNPAAVRDRVGYMPDFFGVYESLTVAEYLDFYGASHRIPGARRRQLCDELLELVDLTDKRGESVESLSRGMKQRLGLARCLVHDPEVLLLDEPASGMDPRARIELREILRELSKLNKTILISSHILPELAEMCTHIGIVRAGELIAEGSVDTVIETLTSGARLRVRVLAPEQLGAAVGLLESNPSCSQVEADGNRSVIAVFSGSDDELAALMAEVLGAGIRLTGFGVEGNTLEDVFLQITELSEDGE
ncbi:MAG TPA: ABC transporter ATP-binding protein [Chloroflexota bacterium]